MKNEFITGVNYWASHAGTAMWSDWKPDVVEHDLQTLEENGITHLRVFPLWSDFQPVKALYAGGGSFAEYRMTDERLPANPDYLDERMLGHFHDFCRIALAHHMKLIVGLITGWMSGRLFVPPALDGKNILTDPEAMMFQQKFIRGFVTRMRKEEAIAAWDLGNECNCMGTVTNRAQSYTWTACITNAIKAADHTRPVVSGMHSLSCDQIWAIEDQGESTDILTTHPYPLWVEHCSRDGIASLRTLLHATAQSRFYADIGKKPCLVEEIGTMGPMVCDDKTAAGFLRVNLFSNWAHGAKGLLWWCANDQSRLDAAPYDWNMCERELGILDKDGRPTEMLLEMKHFSAWMCAHPIALPAGTPDISCILSKGQDHWGIAYMSYILAVQAGLSLEFVYAEDGIPKRPAYLLPSISGTNVISKRDYDQLKAYVEEGSRIYISYDDGFLTEFTAFTGLTIRDSSQGSRSGALILDEREIPLQSGARTLDLARAGAKPIGESKDGYPWLSAHEYGKGAVYFLAAPLEHKLLSESDAFSRDYYLIYRQIFTDLIEQKEVRCANPNIGVTIHKGREQSYCVLVNYSNAKQETDLKLTGCRVGTVLYGQADLVEACDACVMELEVE